MNRRTLTAFLGATAATALWRAPAARAQPAEAEPDLSLVVEMAEGDAEAPLEVIEYGSFTCPHCANFHVTVFGQLKQNYIDTGKVRFINREVYFDRYGLWAGMLARCGDSQQRYFGILDVLYRTQREWAGSSDPAVVAGNLRRIGRTAGISDDELDACFADSEKARAMVAFYQQTAAADNVEGTPTFIINGRKYSNMGYDDFAGILDGLLTN